MKSLYQSGWLILAYNPGRTSTAGTLAKPRETVLLPCAVPFEPGTFQALVDREIDLSRSDRPPIAVHVCNTHDHDFKTWRRFQNLGHNLGQAPRGLGASPGLETGSYTSSLDFRSTARPCCVEPKSNHSGWWPYRSPASSSNVAMSLLPMPAKSAGAKKEPATINGEPALDQ